MAGFGCRIDESVRTQHHGRRLFVAQPSQEGTRGDRLGHHITTCATQEKFVSMEAMRAEGITEIIYQPTGPDIAGELEAFYTAVTAAGQDNPGSDHSNSRRSIV